MSFRKRKKRNRKQKKEQNEDEEEVKDRNQDDDDDEDEDDDLSFLHKLKETKTIHKLQFESKDKGLIFEENHEFTSSGLENPDNFKHVKYLFIFGARNIYILFEIKHKKKNKGSS